MPTIPNTTKLTGNSVNILNAIRNSATDTYQSYVPYATNDVSSLRGIGNIIMQIPALQNEFLSALVNRIGRVLITSKMYSNPWAILKRGLLEYGETVEEIFVNIAKPFTYNPDEAANKVFAREIPDVQTAFHILNYQKFYKATIQNEQLRQAFLSWQGITDLIAKIVDSMYSGAYYDEFQVMKYMIAKQLLNGNVYAKQIPETTTANMKAIVSEIKGVSNAFEFMTRKYNTAGVANYSKKDDQYIILNSTFDATMDVEVLATAFNMDKADFMGHRILVDGFGTLDTERLRLLLGDKYTEITDAELEALNGIPALIVDRDWFMIFDNLYNFTDQYNAEGLYWNYWYHVWKTFSTSPFANAVVFVGGAPTITAVTISPETATATSGQTVQFKADVATTNFADQSVIWSLTADDDGTDITDTVDAAISASGLLQLGTVDSGVTITVTATSTVDSTKSASATVTVA